MSFEEENIERKTHYFEKAANNKQCSNSGFALMFVMHVLPVLYRVMGK